MHNAHIIEYYWQEFSRMTSDSERDEACLRWILEERRALPR